VEWARDGHRETGFEDIDAESPDYRFEVERDLRRARRDVINRRTGEVLSSVIADVVRERREAKLRAWQERDEQA
jgi:hypothetical protein